MGPDAPCKLGLFLPAGLHQRDGGRQSPHAQRRPASAPTCAAFVALLDSLDAGVEAVFAAVRGPKRRVTVRASHALCLRLRERLARLNLKITDFACAAIVRSLLQT